jgi:hypothetical protein
MSTGADIETNRVALIVPPEVARILGKPPVTRVEDRAAYDRLFADLAIEWEPRSITEWLHLKDLADLSWDVLRKRRAIADILDTSLRAALQALLRSADPNFMLEPQQLLDFACNASRNADMTARLKYQLTRFGFDLESALGQAFLLRCDELEKLERMLASAEARRARAIRNFHDYRSMRSARLSLIEATAASVVPDDGGQ